MLVLISATGARAENLGERYDKAERDQNIERLAARSPMMRDAVAKARIRTAVKMTSVLAEMGIDVSAEDLIAERESDAITPRWVWLEESGLEAMALTVTYQSKASVCRIYAASWVFPAAYPYRWISHSLKYTRVTNPRCITGI